MKIQFEILLFIACLNLATGMILALSLAGTENVAVNQPPISAEDYESHFNASETASGWDTNIITGIPIIGDIFSGFNFLFSNAQYLIDGFPTLLTWIGDNYIIDQSGRDAFNYIAWALRGVYAILMSILVIEFISGRYMTD